MTGFAPARALAQEKAPAQNTAADAQHNTEQPKEAEGAAPVLSPASPAIAPTTGVVPPPPPPKFGDVSVTGYFRGGFGASNQKGRMTCFALALPGGLISKYRLGNECEVWSETHFTVVSYVGDDGSVAHLHFMPTIYIPTSHLGYSPNGTTSSPLEFTTSTGATVSFPNLYADIQGIPWLGGGTVWAGTRYYKRESIYISDFFYWNPSGVGAGIEDIKLTKDLRLSYAAFAVDGEPAPPAAQFAPQLPAQADFGLRNDLQLRGLRLWQGSELQFGFQGIVNFSNDPATHGGWGVTIQYVQKLLDGDNKLAGQYGRGGGTGFGTLARFYYPDFSVRHDLNELRFRIVDVLTIQPTAWLGQQVGFVYQHDNLGTSGGQTDWWSFGTRLALAPIKHFKGLVEYGYDRVIKNNGLGPQWLSKITGALALTGDRGFLARPEIRLFVTWARWNDAAAGAKIDSGPIYVPEVYPDFLSGAIFGLQAETWW